MTPDARDRAVAEAFCARWVTDVLYRDVAEAELTAALATARAEEREACARAAERVVPRHTECGNRIAAALRARGEG